MLLDAKNLSKSIGAKYLFKDISFAIEAGEKIGLIGRNGNGKTTLLKVLSGEDHQFEGKIITAKGTNITLTKQEHHANKQSAVEYILDSVPNYHEYRKKLEDYEEGRTTNLNKYLKILEKFTENRFVNLPSAVENTLVAFNIPLEDSQKPLEMLSGGQKRYVELTRMMFSQADLLLIDEPTNHLDYVGKERFISWMSGLKQAVMVVTHDRDVLKHVDKIFEIKDQKLLVFRGNYDQYISQNTTDTLSSVKQYNDQLNRLKEAKKRVEWGLRMRAKSKAWKIKYDHWLRDYEKLKAATVKPSFWIDQNSVENLDKKVVDSYHKFKEKNININISSRDERGIEHLKVSDLSLGYKTPIFENLHFLLKDAERIFIKGRNGAGKSTFVKTVQSQANGQTPVAKLFSGKIEVDSTVRIGEYQQEIEHKFLSLSLEEAIRQSYREKKKPIDTQKIKSLLAQYLFNPTQDANQKISNLSGGQKARFQIIRMLIDEPNLLILDEPTNHLDLPSIEELENALGSFTGAILYISHDTYFIEKMGGRVVEI